MLKSMFKLNKERINFIDVGKFLAIILVVLIHVLQRTVIGFTSESSYISRILLLLSVTPFFLFSGMSYRYKKEVNPLGFIYNILKRGFIYFVPFVWFILFRIWIYKQWPDFNVAMEELMEYPVSGLWVCWILLWISIAVDIGLFISSIYPRLKILFVSSMLIIGIIVLVILRNTGVIVYDHSIGYDYFIIYTPVFLLGYLLGPYVLKLKNIYVLISFMVIGLAGLIPLCIYNPDFITTKFLANSEWPMHLATLCATMFFIGLTYFVNKVPFSPLLSYLGQFTLEVYFLHLMLLKHWTVMELGNGWIIFLVTTGLFILCFINSYGVTLITMFVPFLHFILFGRHLSIYKFEDKFFEFIKNICYSKGKKINNENVFSRD